MRIHVVASGFTESFLISSTMIAHRKTGSSSGIGEMIVPSSSMLNVSAFTLVGLYPPSMCTSIQFLAPTTSRSPSRPTSLLMYPRSIM